MPNENDSDRGDMPNMPTFPNHRERERVESKKIQVCSKSPYTHIIGHTNTYSNRVYYILVWVLGTNVWAYWWAYRGHIGAYRIQLTSTAIGF